MIFVELFFWLWDHWEDLTITGILLFVGRKLILKEVKRLFNMNENEELQWTREKVEQLSGEKWSGPVNGYRRVRTLYTTISILYLRRASLLGRHLRRMKMKSYLKKLGSRKFQAYLLTTVLNILTAYLTWSGEVDVSARIEGFMPLINVGIQLIATAVYTWVEGKIDKETVKQADTANPENYYR